MPDLTKQSRSFARYVQDNVEDISSFTTQIEFTDFVTEAQDQGVYISDMKVKQIIMRLVRSTNLFSMQKVLFDSLLAGAGLSVIK